MDDKTAVFIKQEKIDINKLDWKKYRKKPVVIRAVKMDTPFDVKMLDGTTHYGSEGDYLIEGVQKELYACKPDIFEATYEDEE